MNANYLTLRIAKKQTPQIGAAWWSTTCTILFAGIYLDIPFPLLGGSFPMASAVPGAIMSAILWPNKTLKILLIALLISTFFLILSIFLFDTPNPLQEV